MNFVWVILVYLVEVPEEEKLSPAGGGASHMAKEVAVDIPESSVKAQDHLQWLTLKMRCAQRSSKSKIGFGKPPC